MSQAPAPFFEVMTPLDFSVRISVDYWELLQQKHPEISGRLREIQRCLIAPERVRRSKQDDTVFLFYRPIHPYHLCVVAKRLNGSGFIVTCYITDAIKEGEQIWPASE